MGSRCGGPPPSPPLPPPPPPAPPPSPPGRICAPAASLGSCCEGMGAAATKGRKGGGGTHRRQDHRPPSVPPSRGCRSSWLEAGGEGGVGCCTPRPPGQNPLMRGDKSSLGPLWLRRAGTAALAKAAYGPGTKPARTAPLPGAGVGWGDAHAPSAWGGGGGRGGLGGSHGVRAGEGGGTPNTCHPPRSSVPSTRTPRRGRYVLEQLDAVTLGLYITQIAACSSLAGCQSRCGRGG